MEHFKFFDGSEIENLGDYLLEYYAKYPDIKIYIGTDSAQHGKVTKYATAISLLRPGKGVHVVYKKFSIRKEKDIFTRLWKEAEYTRETADYVHSIMEDVYEHKDNKKIPILHLDFNKQAKYKY